jgi:hypothetical protein
MKKSTYTVLVGILVAMSGTASFASEYRSQQRRQDVLDYLERSKQIKSEVVSEMKSMYGTKKDDLVGLDSTMDSFEVNELVAEIIEAEMAQ